jgi:hypothetical protein
VPTVLGTFTDVIDVLAVNASSAILVTPEGMTTVPAQFEFPVTTLFSTLNVPLVPQLMKLLVPNARIA